MFKLIQKLGRVFGDLLLLLFFLFNLLIKLNVLINKISG